MRTVTPHLCKCGQSDPAEFYPGRKSLCKACTREKHHAYYLANRERCLANSKAWAARNPESNRHAVRRYLEKNPTHERERARRRRQDPVFVAEENAKARERRAQDPEKERARLRALSQREDQKARRKRWRAANRERENATARARRAAKIEQARRWARENARRRRLGYDATALYYTDILLRDPCAYCGEVAEEIDHIDPVAREGVNEWDNLTATCGTCNKRKHAEPLLLALVGRRLMVHAH